jgi:hypothetical protein
LHSNDASPDAISARKTARLISLELGTELERFTRWKPCAECAAARAVLRQVRGRPEVSG